MTTRLTNFLSRAPVFIGFFYLAYQYRYMITALAVRDLQSRYVGTLGGILWAVIHPVAIVSVFYFVFAVGFRAQGPSNVPFILWFVSGLVPWFLFNDTLMAITNSVTGNARLVKKNVFPSEIFPLVHTGASLFPHLIFLFILLGLLVIFDVPLLAERILVAYYLVCTIVLVCGLGWLLSSLQVFYRDISQALPVILNVWFWSTPIVWPQTMVSEKYLGILFWNPIYYIVEGYRDILIYDSVIWPTTAETSYFWGITTFVLVLGTYVFRRLKPEFADVS